MNNQQLVTQYIPYAAKIARNYRGYNISFDDLLSEACIGLIKAADNFDDKRGVPFPAYALFWIKSQVRSFIMNNLSIVKIANTQVNRKVVFGGAELSVVTKSKRGRDYNFDDYFENITSKDQSLEKDIIHNQDLDMLKIALSKLQKQTKTQHWLVFCKRYLSDNKPTLSEVGKIHNLSAEGVRKIEQRILKQLQDTFHSMGKRSDTKIYRAFK